MKKILVIEGDDAVNNSLEATIKSLGLEFLGSKRLMPVHEIHQLEPDVVLLEHRLPFGFGGDLCKELKTDPRTRNIKVILTSTYQGISKVARENLADGYLHKPFDPDTLTATVSKFLTDHETILPSISKRSFWDALKV